MIAYSWANSDPVKTIEEGYYVIIIVHVEEDSNSELPATIPRGQSF